MEVMSLEEMPWRDHHHRSSFLPPCHMVEEHFTSNVSSDIVTDPKSPILTHNVEYEGHLCKITKTMSMYISVKPGISEHNYIGQNSSLMQGFFPSSDPPLASQTTYINMISISHTEKGKAVADESSFFPFRRDVQCNPRFQ